MQTRTRTGGGGWCVRRVPPLQGWDGLFWASSQGVALGWRVVAPLARQIRQPEGLQPVSPGQRPGNSAIKAFPSPERATPGNALAHDLEQAIAGNVAEILEA